MDVQIKKGLLDICVLAVLKRGDSYGYKIIEDLSDVIVISESTLYPILKRLEQGGAVTAYSVEHNGRLRRYYKITKTGVEATDGFLKDWKEMEKIYNFVKGDKDYE